MYTTIIIIIIYISVIYYYYNLQDVIIKQLNTQRQLNQQLHAMSDMLMRKDSYVDPQASPNLSSHLFQVVHDHMIIKYGST